MRERFEFINQVNRSIPVQLEKLFCQKKKVKRF